MKPLTPQSLPVTAAEISDAWIDVVAAIVRRDGHALRAGPTFMRAATPAEIKAKGGKQILVDPLTIEAQSINEPTAWGKIMLEHGGYTFATLADRDAVLERIQRRAARE